MKLPYKIRRKVVGKINTTHDSLVRLSLLIIFTPQAVSAVCIVAAGGGDEVACDLEYEVTADLMH